MSVYTLNQIEQMLWMLGIPWGSVIDHLWNIHWYYIDNCDSLD